MPTKRRRHPTRANLLLSWHRWCGLVALVFLLLAALSGSLLVYKQALVRLIITPHASLPVGYSVQQMAPQLEHIAQLIQHDPTAYLIKAPSREEPYWTLTRDADHQVQLLALDSLAPYEDNLWLLQVLGFLRSVHTELFAGVVGEALLLGSGVLGLFLAITGVILWWPTKRSFRWRWVLPRRISPQYLLHYHRHLGTLAVPLLLVILLTGSIMLWQKLMGPILAPPPSTHIPAAPNPTASPAQLLVQAQTYVPDGWPTYIRLGSTANPSASFRYRLPGEWHPNGRTSVKFDLATGAITVSARSDQVDWQQNLINQNYPLHSGYGMNGVYRLLVICGGITLLWLALTGGWSYLRRTTK
ncbi:MAG TPA: PepSY-associated TM helix domain-containing protein [Cellvibrio sp.]|nr:PepSY-associated TM helix domain-containing protein [Cellvibrio sp.]